MRALLGLFSLESLQEVTRGARATAIRSGCSKWWRNWSGTARTCSISAASLSRYFRNLLVARICGSETQADRRFGGASRRGMRGDRAARFTEEDLTRYLQFSLELFRDLQASLQPRFHLEIGLAAAGACGQAAADRAGAGGR